MSDRRIPEIRKSGEVERFLSSAAPPSPRSTMGRAMIQPRSHARESSEKRDELDIGDEIDE